MSAPIIERSRFEDDSSRFYYYFQQTKLIPSYAVVIVVGILRRGKIGPRSSIFAEEKFFQKSIKIFANIERMLLAAENLCGSCVFSKISIHSLFKFICILNFLFVLSTFVFFYIILILLLLYFWIIFLDPYDICVLPPSISFLKIQCPNVTFVSPILIGDISISHKISMNIANNWAGNSVTCKNYYHLWLHESFSRFIYMKIINRIFTDKELAQFVSKIEFDNLQMVVKY